MARSSIPQTPPSKQLTPREMQLGIERLGKRIDEVRSFDSATVSDQFDNPGLDKVRASVADALSRTFGENTAEYKRYSSAASFSTGPINVYGQPPVNEIRAAVTRSQERSVALLEQAIESLREQLLEAEPAAAGSLETLAVPLVPSRKVFVVHGHDGEAREAVARFLSRIGFDPVILHERANQGRTVIEKVEVHGDVGFAVVLLTPDDVGSLKGAATLEPRARQNVLLELGYFVGRLGRHRVCALRKGEVQVPSDFGGVVYEPLDDAGAWRMALARELEAADYAMDWNKVMRP